MKKYISVALMSLSLVSSLSLQAANPGKDIYDKKCASCHAAGIAGAPKLADNAAWAPRLKNGIDALVASVINGKNAMPPKGACADCSDNDLRSAVEYMTSTVK